MKTMANDLTKANNPTLANLSRLERAAILLMSLGEKDAAEILKHMGPKEVQRVGTAMATLSNINQSQVEGVVAEFLEAISGQTGLGLGADDYIRKMLTQALGGDKASALIDRILLGGNTTGLDSLKWMEPRQVSDLIRHEHPQIQAIVISYLEQTSLPKYYRTSMKKYVSILLCVCLL